jgi:hypothetical protein
MGSEKQKQILLKFALHGVGAFLSKTRFFCAMTVPSLHAARHGREGCFLYCFARRGCGSNRRKRYEGGFPAASDAHNWCTRGVAPRL